MKDDVDNPERPIEEERPAFLIRHLTGSRRGHEERIEDGVAGIGRGRSNRIALDPEADRTVSARHAEIRIESGAVVLYDLGSLNGTYVNGRRVRRSELADGDEIGLGREGPRLVVSRVGAVALRKAQGDGPKDAFDPAPAAPRAPELDPRRKTATSARPKVDFSPKTALALAIAAVLVVALVFAVRAFSDVSDVRDRVAALERDGERPASSDGAAFVVAPTPTAIVVVRGVVSSADGRVLSKVDLGAGVYVARRAVAVVSAVDRETRTFLKGGGVRSVEASPDGRSDAAVRVLGSRAAPEATGGPESVVLLELAHDLGAPTATPRFGAPPKEVRVARPGFAEEKATIEERLTASGARAPDEGGAYYLRSTALNAGPGAALLDQDGALVGLAAGPARPGLALGGVALKAALDARETTPIDPFK